MTDDDLRVRLSRADPAAQLAPSTPDRIAQLLENSMTVTEVRRRPAMAYAAAALVLVAAVAGLLLWRSPGHDAGPGSATAGTTAVQLALGGTQANCVEPQAASLAEAADLAFAGTVTGIQGQTVTLQVTHTYKGANVTAAQVRQTGDTSEQLVGADGTFQLGRKYLVAAAEGQVMICGYSGEADAPGLRDLYDQAF